MTKLGQVLIKGLKEAVEMEKGIPMKSYEVERDEAAEYWKRRKKTYSSNYLKAFSAGADWHKAKALKASDGLVKDLENLLMRWDAVGAQGTTSYNLLKKALEQFQREVGK